MEVQTVDVANICIAPKEEFLYFYIGPINTYEDSEQICRQMKGSLIDSENPNEFQMVKDYIAKRKTTGNSYVRSDSSKDTCNIVSFSESNPVIKASDESCEEEKTNTICKVCDISHFSLLLSNF